MYEARTAQKTQIKAQQAGWTETLTASFKSFDAFIGLETLAAKGLHAMADNPSIAGTPFGQALSRVASSVGTVGAFNDGVREGVWNGGKALVTGIVTIAGKALQYGGDSTVLGRAGDSLRGVTGTMPGWLEATIPSKQRGLASDAAIGAAAGKAVDYLSTHSPEQAGADIADAVSKAWGRLEADHAKAAA